MGDRLKMLLKLRNYYVNGEADTSCLQENMKFLSIVIAVLPLWSAFAEKVRILTFCVKLARKKSLHWHVKSAIYDLRTLSCAFIIVQCEHLVYMSPNPVM